jgi:hypothetical protein
VAQNVAQTLWVKLGAYLLPCKKQLKIWAASVIFKTLAKIIKIPKVRKFAQSGNPALKTAALHVSRLFTVFLLLPTVDRDAPC